MENPSGRGKALPALRDGYPEIGRGSRVEGPRSLAGTTRSVSMCQNGVAVACLSQSSPPSSLSFHYCYGNASLRCCLG
jgi:hypothetical protein